MFCSLMSVFMYFSGFESFAPLERWCDFAKFWCGKKKLVAVQSRHRVWGLTHRRAIKEETIALNRNWV